MSKPADLPLAEIIEEVRRQVANFQTVILKTGHALRLVAIAETAMEMRRFIRHNEQCLIWATGAPYCTCGLTAAHSAFDALASPAPVAPGSGVRP